MGQAALLLILALSPGQVLSQPPDPNQRQSAVAESQTEPQAEPQADLSARRFAELVADLDQQRAAAGVAGGLVLITNKDRVLHAAGFGVTHRDQPEPMHPEVWIRIGSVTKGFVGLAFLNLAAQTKLPLTARLDDLGVGQFVDNPWSDSHPVTLEQLLEHSAGLTDLVRAEWDHNTPLPLREALAVAPESRRLRWRPGVHSSYSNSGAGVAAAAAESVEGLFAEDSFEAYLEQQVLRPMGMPKATFSAAVKPLLIGGYDRDGTTPIRYWHVLYRPFGGLNMPFSELGQYLRLLLGNGRIDGKQLFEPAQIQRMESPASTAAARSGLTFGYGLGNYHQSHRGFVFHGHGGDADGYLTHCAYNRQSGLGFCVLINAFQNSTLRTMRRRVMDYVVDGLTPRYTPGVPQPLAHLQRLTGVYTQATYRFGGSQPPATATVELDNGRLMLRRGNQTQHLVPLSRWHFRRRFEPIATTAFIEEDGQMLLQGPFGNFQRAQKLQSEQ